VSALYSARHEETSCGKEAGRAQERGEATREGEGDEGTEGGGEGGAP
jgi:hypothetical protein